MDIRSAYSAALSSLSVTQYQSSVTSANIANANVEGYSALTVNTTTTFSGGNASGVGVSSVSSYVNENLYKSYVSANSDAAYTSVVSDYQNVLMSEYGTVDSENSLPDLLTDLETSVADLAVTPESQTLKNAVLTDADEVANELNDLSNEIQDQRANVDKDIETAVDDVNQALQVIEELNEEIAVKTALGQDTATLEDTRNQALLVVSENLDVTYFTTNSNEMHVYTSTGKPLVDSRAHELSYDATANVSSNTSFNGIMLDGEDVTGQLKGGKIGGLIDLRDEILPAKQAELDELAQTMADTLNAVLNTGSPYPPQNTVTGQETVAGTDTFSATGSMRIVVSDEDGTAQSVTDLDLSTYSTVDDLVAGINGISGVSASINGDGKLVISSDDPDMGIALSEMDSSVGADGQGVSDYFGMNDLFTGTDAGSISVRDDLKDNPTLLATGKVSDDPALSVGDTALTSGDASVALALQEAMNTPVSFDDAGDMDATKVSLQEYSADLLGNFALSTQKAESDAETKQMISDNLAMDISNQSGVNLDEEAARLTVLENQYSASAQIIQTLDDMFNSLLTAVS